MEHNDREPSDSGRQQQGRFQQVRDKLKDARETPTAKKWLEILRHPPRLFYILLGFVLMGSWVVVMLTFVRHETKAQRKNNQAATPNHDNPWPGDRLVQGSLREFDTAARTLTVDWSLLSAVTNDTYAPITDEEIGIYQDVVAKPAFDATAADQQWVSDAGWSWSQIFQVDNVTMAPTGIVGVHDWDSVSTDITMTQVQSDSAWRHPLFGYPWDQWEGSIVLVASDRTRARATNQSNAYVVELYGSLLADSLLNWRITATSKDTCHFVDTPGCELHIDFHCRRPGLVTFSAVVAIIVNWFSTILIFIMTCEVVVIGRDSVIESAGLLAVCFTALFALPSVRSILPGAPDFGAIIDLVGIIPNVIAISLCTTMVSIQLLRGLLHQRQTDEESEGASVDKVKNA